MFEGPDYERIAPLLDAHGWDAGFFQQHYRDAWIAEFAGSETGATAGRVLSLAIGGLDGLPRPALDVRAWVDSQLADASAD